ncbi:MAG: alpha/beta hydrolase [Proteobacteria bacterium]|nr:alpha/beta hydrolase [Burkholderiales bacterium]
MSEPAPPPPLPAAVSGERIEFDSAAGRLSYYLGAPARFTHAHASVGNDGELERVPLLLVHSINASGSAAEMRPLYDYYVARRPVYAIDLPGFGFSERGEREYTPRLMTDALHALIARIADDHAGMPIDAAALSLSCEFLARAAMENPGPLRSLALISPTGFSGKRRRYGPPASNRRVGWLNRLLRRPGVGRVAFRNLTRPGVIRYFLARTWGSPNIDEGLLAYDLITTKQPGARHAPIEFLSATLFSNDVNTLYEALRMPVWMSHGVRGDFVDYRGKSTVEGRANWSFSVFPTGALPYFETGDAFVGAYDTFLMKVGQQSTASEVRA